MLSLISDGPAPRFNVADTLLCFIIGVVVNFAAMALRSEVFFDSGGGQTDSHTSNGTQWYYSDNMSMGFAQVGDSIKRQNCDTLSTNAGSRLCWRTADVNGGYRCGATMLLNNSTDWERVVYQRNGSL